VPIAIANGLELRYEREGDGPPLLFLNGSGATLAGSQPLLGVFRSRFDVVAHDQRGLGDSAIPPGPYEMADYAADALALLEHVGWERCRVVGISFGGMVAQELAVTAPERVERLALVCTSPGGAAGASYPLHELEGPGPVTLLDTRFDDAWLAAHDADRALVEMLADRPAPTDGMRLQLDARSRHDVGDRLERITCPTLVACGRYDGIAPVANSEAIAARVAGAELRVYEGGHAFVAQDRAALPEILEFLGC
jgi:pimeloyl-ACP methyl ester carboxylesterase